MKNKKIYIVLCLLILVSTFVYSKPPKGGFVPCLSTCCLGPRVGLEMNEGTKVTNDEWLGLISGILLGVNVNTYMSSYKAFTGESMNEIKDREKIGGPLITASQPKETGGFVPALASCCLGPRIGLEMNDGRKVRSMELFTLVPIIGIVPAVMMAYEAYEGKTMSEIAENEELDK